MKEQIWCGDESIGFNGTLMNGDGYGIVDRLPDGGMDTMELCGVRLIDVRFEKSRVTRIWFRLDG